MWPVNPAIQASLANSGFSFYDKQFFLAMTSTTSLIWAFWFVWRIIRELKRKDTFYMRRWLPGFAIIAPLCVLGALNLSFVADGSFYAPSLKQADFNRNSKIHLLHINRILHICWIDRTDALIWPYAHKIGQPQLT